jgi:hypothetical protein
VTVRGGSSVRAHSGTPWRCLAGTRPVEPSRRFSRAYKIKTPFDYLSSHELLYAPGVGSQVWIGAATTLLGVVLGGAASFTLSRQQMKDARAQRAEEAARERDKRSEDRRIQAYSDFLTRARSFRNALMNYCYRPQGKLTLDILDDLMREAADASALVFLVVETPEVYNACRVVLRAIRNALNTVQNIDSGPTKELQQELRGIVGPALRDFQISAREELGFVHGVVQPWREHPKHPYTMEVTRETPSDP